jgi:UDP-N-acetylglucosamine 2-epimerase (non-hydrolysing)
VKRVMLVLGTRPEAIKIAPVVLAMREHAELDPYVVLTAQHRDMLDQVVDLFELPVHEDLDLMRPRQTLADLTARVVQGIDGAVGRVQPDALLVQGDTTTSFASGLAAFYHHVPVVHLEAGLRTADPWVPFPEEMNRRITTRLTALHLAPTPANRRTLLAESVPADDVVVTGNTVIDALQWASARPGGYGDPRLDALHDDPRRVVLVTTHRRESWGEPLRGIARAIRRLAEDFPDCVVAYPLHMNPVVREAVLPEVSGLPNVIVTEPLGYADFARLMARSFLIVSDSGGVQEEGPSLGRPVLVLREATERQEALDAGTARLVGTREEAVYAATHELLTDQATYDAMSHAANPYGDGKAAARATAAIGALLGVDSRLPDFGG